MEGYLVTNGSQFNGKFNAERLTVGENLFMGDGAIFQGLVVLTGAKVTGNLLMNNRAEFREVNLLNAKIGGNLEVNGSRFNSWFSAKGLDVGNHLLMNDGAIFQGLVVLTGAKVTGALDASGSKFHGEFGASQITVGENLLMGDGAEFREVNLLNAKVEGYLVTNGSQFNGKFRC